CSSCASTMPAWSSMYGMSLARSVAMMPRHSGQVRVTVGMARSSGHRDPGRREEEVPGDAWAAEARGDFTEDDGEATGSRMLAQNARAANVPVRTLRLTVSTRYLDLRRIRGTGGRQPTSIARPAKSAVTAARLAHAALQCAVGCTWRGALGQPCRTVLT